MKKKIKITSRGVVLTSRGMARTPIDQPYYETVEQIRLLITRFKSNVVEVLSDGTEIPLTIQNFSEVHTPAPIKVESVEELPMNPPIEEPEDVDPTTEQNGNIQDEAPVTEPVNTQEEFPEVDTTTEQNGEPQEEALVETSNEEAKEEAPATEPEKVDNNSVTQQNQNLSKSQKKKLKAQQKAATNTTETLSDVPVEQ